MPSDPLPSAPDTTREALLTAATDVFGAHGFDGATTRMLSRAAGVNQQAIPYYFGGKAGLYAAVIDRLADYMQAALSPVHAEIAAFLADPGPPRQARDLLSTLMRRLARLYCAPETEAPARVIMRELQAPGPGFARLHDHAIGPILADVAALIGHIRPDLGDRETLRLHALSLVGGVLVFLFSRPVALTQLGLDHLTPEATARIEDHAGALVADLARGLPP